MKAAVKQLLFRLGLARLLHRLRNRRVLTVVMFHRVLPPEDPRFAGANPAYTLRLDAFERCLDLLGGFYSIVDLDAVERAARGAPLPPCPLLITFDDGWRDNLEYALPALAARRMPAVLFVASGFIGDARGFWQERVFDAMAASGREAEAPGRITALAALEMPARETALAAIGERPLPRCMANIADLAAMAAAGIAIGGHGHSHAPLTEVADARAELRACRETLAAHGLGGARPAFSFPHGRCDAALVAAAQAAGFGLCFTSAPHLVPPDALADPRGIGRISIELPEGAAFDPSALAFSLITRPHA